MDMEQQIFKYIEDFFIIIGVCICLYIVWAAWSRIKNDQKQGGITQVLITIVKLIVVITIFYYLIKYGEETGFFKNIANTIFPPK